MSSDPGQTDNAIVKYGDESKQQQIKKDNDDHSNNSNKSSSTQYGGHGASPNVAATIKSKDTKKVYVDNNEKVDFEDELGPVVLNVDGTISRIKNWHNLTKTEQDKIKIRIGKRNAKRRAALLQQESKKNEINKNDTDKSTKAT